MSAIENAMDKLGKIKVADVPVGQSLLLLGGLGINDALISVINGFGCDFLASALLSGTVRYLLLARPSIAPIIRSNDSKYQADFRIY